MNTMFDIPESRRWTRVRDDVERDAHIGQRSAIGWKGHQMRGGMAWEEWRAACGRGQCRLLGCVAVVSHVIGVRVFLHVIAPVRGR